MSINNSFLARLSIIINKLGGGVSIVEYKRKKDNSLIVYDVNRSKELIKCE